MLLILQCSYQPHSNASQCLKIILKVSFLNTAKALCCFQIQNSHLFFLNTPSHVKFTILLKFIFCLVLVFQDSQFVLYIHLFSFTFLPRLFLKFKGSFFSNFTGSIISKLMWSFSQNSRGLFFNIHGVYFSKFMRPFFIIQRRSLFQNSHGHFFQNSHFSKSFKKHIFKEL